MEKDDILKMVSELLEAKKNVLFCLNTPNGSAGMHGLSYWANVVETKRKEILNVL